MSAPKYLLRWKGRQSGPFTPDEIRGRLKNSEIGLMHEVQVEGLWITVEKFLALTAPPPPAPPPPKQEKKVPAPSMKIEEPKPTAPLLPPVPLPPLVPLMTPEHGPLFTVAKPCETTAQPSSDEILSYAGFWLRSVAAVIDGVVVTAISWALAAMVLMVSGGTLASLPLWLVLFVIALYAVGSWLYFALMESSEIQATLGKLAVGLIVTDLVGAPISFGRANGRSLGRILSCVTFGSGCFMAAFTERKQALHDTMSGCYVLLKLSPARIFHPQS